MQDCPYLETFSDIHHSYYRSILFLFLLFVIAFSFCRVKSIISFFSIKLSTFCNFHETRQSVSWKINTRNMFHCHYCMYCPILELKIVRFKSLILSLVQQEGCLKCTPETYFAQVINVLPSCVGREDHNAVRGDAILWEILILVMNIP